ncbi:hydroxymethylglutaryl-CoA lyase [Granulicella cerasi]|uniref:Hydroxymethylglutaryl-CoA lyase n=1 Tax=Granulicella cerasi TaxID=741063 RepID=A0ABW1ZE40_9BACT|nr:hydroxymethylglutaryl-CoA lyase [Granulicella cerasi]
MVKIVESPRDLFQSLRRPVRLEDKARYLRALVETGFQHMDAVGFVSPRFVPQLADAEEVLEYLDPPDDVEIIGLVVDADGAKQAVKTRAVSTLGFSYSISPTFLDRSQRQTPEDALEQLEQIGEIAYKAGLDMVAYVAMAFGNPYRDAWDVDEVVSAVDLLMDAGVEQVTLADTAGVADANLVGAVMSLALDVHDNVEIGVRLRGGRSEMAGKVKAAYAAGCRRFDSCVAGRGALELVGDAAAPMLPTEVLIAALREAGAELPRLRPLDGLVTATADLAKRFG